MKKTILSLMTVSLLPLSAMANCKLLAEQAALNFVKSTVSKRIVWDVGHSRLKQQSGSTLIYEIGMLSSYSDGASSEEFPIETFVVRATGSVSACKITGVKSK